MHAPLDSAHFGYNFNYYDCRNNYCPQQPNRSTYIHKHTVNLEASDRLMKIKTDELISSMQPADLMSLANEDVSYIIIKVFNIIE